VAAPEPTSTGRRGPELSSRGGRARSHGTRGSVEAHLSRKARFGAEECVAALKLNSTRRRGPGPRATWEHRSSPQRRGEVRGRGTRGGSGAHLCREVWSEATACVAALDACPTPCLNLELVSGVPGLKGADRGLGPTSGEAVNPHVGPIFRRTLGYLIFLLDSRRRAHHQHGNIGGGPLGGAGVEGPGAPTTNMKTSTAGPWEVLELKVWERPPPT
jgi:hypothetical protein